MTLALYGKSRARQQALLFAGFMAVVAAALFAVTAFRSQLVAAVTLPDTENTASFTQGQAQYRYVLTAVSHTPDAPLPGQTTFVYTIGLETLEDTTWVPVTGDTAEALLSHWVAQLAEVCGGETNVATFEGPGGSGVYGPDGSTGLTGFKFDPPPLFGTYTLVMNGSFGIVEDGFTAHFKQGSEPTLSASVAGPDCGTVAGSGTVTVTKTHADLAGGEGDGSYIPGEWFTFTLTFDVVGGAIEGPLGWNDVLPEGTEFIGLGSSVNPGGHLNCGGDPTTDVVTCTLADDAPEGTYSQDVTVGVEQTATCGPIVNTVRVGLAGGEGVSVDTDTVAIVGCGELLIEKSDSSEVSGQPPVVTWTIELHNTSDTAQTAYVFDASSTLVSSTGCNPAATQAASGVIVCLVPPDNLNPAPEATVTVTNMPVLTVEESCTGTTVENTAYLVDSDTDNQPDPSEDPSSTASADIPGTASADCITVHKTFDNASSEGVVWNITFVNSGPAATVDFSDTYEPGISGTTISGGGGICDTVTSTQLTGCSMTVEPGTSSHSITTTLPANLCADFTVSNTVAASFNGTPLLVTSGESLTASHLFEADADACRETIQLCKAWTLDAPGEVADVGSVNFSFNVSDSEEPPPGELVVIPGVVEAGDLECVLLNVQPGLVSIEEIVPAGFVVDGWVSSPGATPPIGPPFGGGTVSFFVGAESCLFQVEVLFSDIQAVVVEPGPVAVEDIRCTVTFYNHDLANRLPSGDLRIEKYLDVNGDGDADDVGLGEGLIDWDISIAGPDVTVAGDHTLTGGFIDFPGLESGDVYTITEDLPPGWVVTNATVDNVTQGETTSVSATIPEGGTTVVRFFNQQLEGITVHKEAQTSHNGVITSAPGDDDGWTITLTSADCGINLSQQTDAAGNTTFTDLPLCDDYVVTESPNNAASPGFVQVSPSGPFTGQSPDGPVLTFVNRRITVDAPCQDCTGATPTTTATPVTPTATPTTPTTAPATPTATPTTPLATITAPITQIAGEQTPGPATPIAPSAGDGPAGPTDAGANALLLMAGIVALSSAAATLALARKRTN